jgi:hypothetical protein
LLQSAHRRLDLSIDALALCSTLIRSVLLYTGQPD